MKRILFDTSVYGRFIYEPEILERIKKEHDKEFIIYGCSTIRSELKKTPKNILIENKKAQIILLDVYDSFIVKENHNLKFNKLVENLTEDYLKEYKKNKGSLSEESIKNDFIIIATATIYQLDIVVSGDIRSMLSNKAIKSYEKINFHYGLKNPEWRKYEDFKKEL
ncbi:MAG: hypothetical protein KKG75_02790 [Nanoarchaeota archaeon]|nr:hypothetical protein [Nanoarchaeota archaeon]